MTEQQVRVGIVGAGANTRLRHIPGFRALSGVEVTGVANSSPESTARAAQELGIPRKFSDWRQLVEDPQIDAVCIGTWPNLHAEITCAALEAGKHVLCEARMARDLAEAQRMWQTSQAHPELVAQIVPSPFGLVHERYIRSLIEDEYFGEIRELVVIGADNQFWDFSKMFHWRQDREISGLNILMMGILHETAMRWCPPTTHVFAQTQIFEPERPDPQSDEQIAVTVPESVQVTTQLANGGRGIYHLSGSILFGPGKQIHLYGSYGTLKAEFGDTEHVWVGRVGDREMTLLNLPQEMRGGWRVEAEFIGAIRGQEPVHFTDFATGLRYMEFTEAVHISAESGRQVELPLSKLA